MSTAGKPFAELLRDAIEKYLQRRKDRTQQAIAMDAGIAAEMLSRHIGGSSVPRNEAAVEKLAQACGVRAPEHLVGAWRHQLLLHVLGKHELVLQDVRRSMNQIEHDLDSIQQGLTNEQSEVAFDGTSLGVMHIPA